LATVFFIKYLYLSIMEAVKEEINFIVSARKYRPATFDTVVGQDHITTTLKNALKGNQLAQAFLFCGPRGVGKTTCARILAKTINCQDKTPDMEACGKCSACLSFQNNGSMSVFELDAASNNSVEDIRNLVEQVRFVPQSGMKKVYIIDEVHMLSTAAFNAFLKTLEEPPPYAIFILATTEKHKIIPTILSRCQIFDFKRIESKDIVEHLVKIATQENIQYEVEALEVIAQKAEGGLRDALSLFDLLSSFTAQNITYAAALEHLHVLDVSLYFEITQLLLTSNTAEIFLTLNELFRNGFEGSLILEGLAAHFRNLLVCQSPKTIGILEVSQKTKQNFLTQAAACSPSFLLSALNITHQAELSYKNAKNQKLHIELTLLKIAHLPFALNLQGESVEIEEKKKLTPTLDLEPSMVKEETENILSIPNPAPKTLFKTPKLNGAAVESKKEETPTEVGQVTQPIRNTTLSLEMIQKPWQTLLETLQNQNDIAKVSLLQKKLQLQPPNTIMIEYGSELETERLEKIAVEISLLFKEISGYPIHLAAIYNPEKNPNPLPEKRLYTVEEKWAHLSEKYPLLEEMKDKFGLKLM
jgi:DNA polymerase III subunit gamma/tau